MTTFDYPVFAFRQQRSAPLQVAFVAPAGNILRWAGVPRKSDELLTGFQRFRDTKRINEDIIPFFRDAHNCSPTALIVALRAESGLGRCVIDVDDPNPEPGALVKGSLRIEVNDEAFESDQLFMAAMKFVEGRLALSSPGSDEVEEEDSEEGSEDEESDEPLHLGSVTLSRMKSLLEDRANWQNSRFREAMVDFVKPAFLIDGQHRASAAARMGEDGLQFMVCGLFDPGWEEQVFQFTVVNLKPKRIPPSLITSIAALSLTREELASVEQRLEDAGVGMREVSIMSLVAYDGRSPFAEKVAMAVGDPKSERDLLGYGAAKRIANVWYRGSRTSLTLIAKELFATQNASNARKQWREDFAWFDFFVAFWDAVKEHYPAGLWQKDSANKLFVGAHLWALQEAILGQADSQMPSAWTVPDDDWNGERGCPIGC